MGWKALEEHFRSATRQDPAPCGEGAIEWDYSRYARALGLTGQPGIDDLPRTGCAMVVGAAAGWERTWRSYADLAASDGWRAVRVSARPSVVVPDPVIYGLGAAVAGPDLIFARSGRSGRPALGKRPRSPGCSIPLAPGERWLIASDRVRRRVCNEIATRGLLVYVEEAHKLTAAAFGVLSYLIKSHRAWQARMLSRDARIYVVLATQEPHERMVRDALERFDVTGTIPAWRTHAEPVPPNLTVEEEHVLEALAYAPLALTRNGVREVFGETGVEAADRMAERGILRTREEYGETCYVPSPEHAEAAEAAEAAGAAGAAGAEGGNRAGIQPAARVLRALQSYYRRRRHGHEHTEPALAEVARDLGQDARALCHISRTPPSTTATIPLDKYNQTRSLDLVGTGTVVAVAMCAARLGEKLRCKRLLSADEAQPVSTGRNYYRIISMFLAAGRANVDTSTHASYIGRLTCQQLDGLFVDAASILAELFLRMRVMGPREIEQRFDAARECLQQAIPPASKQLAGLTAVLYFRAAISVAGVLTPGRDVSSVALSSGRVREAIRSGAVPAAVLATTIYTQCGTRNACEPHLFGERDRCLGLELSRSIGDVADSRVQLGGVLKKRKSGGGSLLLRNPNDEYVAVLEKHAPHALRHRVCRAIASFTGRRMWRMGASRLLLEHGSQTTGGATRLYIESSGMALAMLVAGDFAGACDITQAARLRPRESASVVAILAQTRALVARKSLQWGTYDVDDAPIALPSRYEQHLRLFRGASDAFCSGEMEKARERFGKARAVLGAHVSAEVAMLHAAALDGEMTANAILNSPPGDIAGALNSLLVMKRGTLGDSPAERLRGALDATLVLFERWAKCGAPNIEDAIRTLLTVRSEAEGPLRSVGLAYSAAMARHCPTAFNRLLHELHTRVGSVNPAAPSVRALDSLLQAIEPLLGNDRRLRRLLRRDADPYLVQVGSSPGLTRQVRFAHLNWREDASIFHEARRLLATGGGELTTYAFLGDARAEPTQLDLSVRSSEEGGFWIGAGEIPVPGERQVAKPKRRRVKRFGGVSESAEEVRKLVRVAAACMHAVLITGETGVGKEVVARAIHAQSSRADGPFVVVDCAAICDTLLESELFGHEVGAFTGATRDHLGYLGRANGGTLFIDELDAMSRRMQSVLLRALEQKEYRPLGSGSYRKSDFRVITAALAPVVEKVRRGDFREDLFYRLGALRVDVPPLRARRDDVPLYVSQHAARYAAVVEPPAMALLQRCRWPGNVRQLNHSIEAAIAFAGPSRRISKTHVQLALGAPDFEPPKVNDAMSGLLEKCRLAFVDRSFSVMDFAEACQVSRRTAQRRLADLVRSGRLRREGAGRATRYLFSRGS